VTKRRNPFEKKNKKQKTKTKKDIFAVNIKPDLHVTNEKIYALFLF